MISYSCESLDAHKGVPPVCGVMYSCEALEVVPGDISPSIEGFWESFWRNGLLVAIIHKCLSNIRSIKADCDKYVASPGSFDNGDLRKADIRALKMLPKADMLKLIDGLYNLGELIKRDCRDMSKAKRDDYIKALDGTGITVTFDKVKGQYRWRCGSLWGARFINLTVAAATMGMFIIQAGSMIDRKLQLALDGIPAKMKDKGYEDTSDYIDLCKAVSKLMGQAIALNGITITSKESPKEDTIKALVKSAIEVYQREVREIGYAMTKVMIGLGSTTGFLAWW